MTHHNALRGNVSVLSVFCAVLLDLTYKYQSIRLSRDADFYHFFMPAHFTVVFDYGFIWIFWFRLYFVHILPSFGVERELKRIKNPDIESEE